MQQNKSSKKSTSISIRFRDAKKLDKIRDAAKKEELSFNAYSVRTLYKAAMDSLTPKPSEK